MTQRIAILVSILTGILVSQPSFVFAKPAASVKPTTTPTYLSPASIAPTRDGKTLYIGCATASKVLVFDTEKKQAVRELPVSAAPLGMVLSADDSRLYVTCAAPVSHVEVIDTATGRVTTSIPVGHTAQGPVLSRDGKKLYVCNRFQNCVSEVDLQSGKEIRRIPVQREPVAATITPYGKYLLVANHLHNGRGDVDVVAAAVSIIDTTLGQVVKEVPLPNGSGELRDIKISPDGEIVAVTHVMARFHLPTSQVERGWMNTAALTLIDTAKLSAINTVLLDNVDSGAANPWAIAWSADGKNLLVTHAGTHELSIIDIRKLRSNLALLGGPTDFVSSYAQVTVSKNASDVPNDLAFLVGLRSRVKLAPANGPRAIAVVGNTAYVPCYFSDNLAVVNFTEKEPRAEILSLGPAPEMTVIRRGEMLFNDATICFQGWQSCASCHSDDARVDGLNWDLLNDGIGNPKNNKSLLLAHKTRPAMTLRVRDSAEAAVRAGIQHILFTVQPEDVAIAMDEYLKALKPIPSSHLENGRLSKAAKRGQKIFEKADCATCHPSPLFTDLKPYDVGTAGKFDKPEVPFDTPTLIEIWRTAPYLHDGSAATLEDVVTSHNRNDKHGKTSNLSPEEIHDLVEYLLSL